MVKTKASLHEHLRTSSKLEESDFNRAIDLASRRLGNSGIFALANFDDRRYEHFAEFPGYDRYYLGENRNAIFVPSKKVLVIKAQEVPTKQGHLLVLGLGCEQHVKQHQTLEDTIKQVLGFNAIKIADHPFGKSGIGPYLHSHPKLIPYIDAIEVYNGEACLIKGANQKAQDFYERAVQEYEHLGALSSSDGHSFYELCSSWTEIEFPDINKPKDFIPSLMHSIRKANLRTPRQNYNSYLGAIDHALDLAFLIKIAPKIGLADKFKTDRPEGN